MNLKKCFYMDRAGQPRRAENHRQIAKSTSLDGWKEVWSTAKAHELGVPFGTPVEHEAPENKVDSVPPPTSTPEPTPAVTMDTTPEPPEWGDGSTLEPAEGGDDEPESTTDPTPTSTAHQAPAEVEVPDEPRAESAPPSPSLNASQQAALDASKRRLALTAAAILGGAMARLAVAGSDAPPVPLTANETIELMGALELCADYYFPDFQPGPIVVLGMVSMAIVGPRIEARANFAAPSTAEPEGSPS